MRHHVSGTVLARYRSVRWEMAVVVLAIVVAVSLSGCIQPLAVFTPYSVVTAIVDQPANETRAGIRVTLSGSGATTGDNDSGYTDTTGYVSFRTQQTGYHFIVARHQAYDMTVGGTAANLSISGPMQPFQQGRLLISSPETTVSADYFYPFTGVNSPPQQAPKKLRLQQKTAGKARFMFLAEDSSILQRTLAPDQKPTPFGTVSVTGDWNNFNLTQEDVDPADGAKFLYDDGSSSLVNSQDTVRGDGVYTRVLDLPPGDHTYMFLINGLTTFVRDPYEEKSVQVKAVVRIPVSMPGNGNTIEVREFKASSILVTKDSI
jgi:hypothetical protein